MTCHKEIIVLISGLNLLQPLLKHAFSCNSFHESLSSNISKQFVTTAWPSNSTIKKFAKTAHVYSLLAVLYYSVDLSYNFNWCNIKEVIT